MVWILGAAAMALAAMSDAPQDAAHTDTPLATTDVVIVSKERPPGNVRYFPERAAREGRRGKATVSCTIQANGELSDCSATATPEKYGFEDAALKLRPLIVAKVAEFTKSGVPTAGRQISVPITFNHR
jgi:TonB family protein